MSKSVAEFFGELSNRLGIPVEHEGLKTLLSITTTIPDDVTEKLSLLMTEKEAKQNLNVKNHFTAQFADGVDGSIHLALQELGVDQTLLDEIKGEKSTGKKAILALKKLHEAESAKVKATANKDPEALAKANQQIADANNQVIAIKTEYEAKLAEKDSFLTDYKKRNELAKLLSKHQWSDVVPESIRTDLFDKLLAEDSKKLGVVMQLDGDNLVLKQSADPALIFHYQNKEFTPADLVHKVLTDNKLLQVAQKAAEPLHLTGSRTFDNNGGGAKRSAPNAFQDRLNKAKQDQEAQTV